MGLELPDPARPAGSYVGTVISGGFAFTAGQGPAKGPGKKFQGKVGRDLTVEEGYEAAKSAMLRILAQLKAVLGDLDRVERIVKVSGYINSAEGFTDQPSVLNGASDLLLELYGDSGQHAREALPVSAEGWIACEISMIVKIKE
ncbi:MAG: RidA family protein [Nitrososphaeria archaeon]|nr:RidA family protein [Nitrososphaeria archaeon]NIQ33643.1 RidA family protein [Nitrososphaeria archaeon]